MRTPPRFPAVAAIGAVLLSSLALATDSKGKDFVTDAIQGNFGEVQVGQLAQQRATSPAVKDFGAMLAKDHEAANRQAMEAAKSLGVTPPTDAGREQKSVYEKLSQLQGPQFDREFVKAMVKDHQEDIAKYRKEAGRHADAAVEYAKKTLPDLQKHLQMAQHLQSQQKVASASSSTSK